MLFGTQIAVKESTQENKTSFERNAPTGNAVKDFRLRISAGVSR